MILKLEEDEADSANLVQYVVRYLVFSPVLNEPGL